MKFLKSNDYGSFFMMLPAHADSFSCMIDPFLDIFHIGVISQMTL